MEQTGDIPKNDLTEKKILFEGQEYANTPRIHLLIERAKAIQRQLPPVMEGYTRLWRGNRPGEVGKNLSFTNSLVGIALPFQEGYKGQLSYVDIPQQDLPEYVDKVGSAPDSEFTLPPELYKNAIIVSEASSTK